MDYTTWIRYLTAIERANRRAQRRFHAMLEARDYVGREAALYAESERVVDRLERSEMFVKPARRRQGAA